MGDKTMVMMKRVPPAIKVPPICPPHLPKKPFDPRPPIDFQGMRDRFEFNRLDADKDGVISRGEMTKGAKSIQDHFKQAKRFESFDADKDGNVDQKEYLAGLAKERSLLDLFKDWNPLKGK